MLEGYINIEHNKKLAELAEDKFSDINQLKYIYLKCVDQQDIDKLKNIFKHWSNINKDLTIPISYAKEGGLLVKLNTHKFIKRMGSLMMKTDRVNWFNKKYSVTFEIRQYSFASDQGIKRGIYFALTKIDIWDA